MLKRFCDIVLVIGSAPLWSPLMAIVGAVTYFVHGDPLFFRQRRAGYKGSQFCIYKFRSMTAERGPDGKLLPDEQRLTRFGQFLRSTSLDELPSLINILKGDMALVGPRPLLVDYLPVYSDEQARRHDVRPGLTGWAQVNGRNLVDWNERLQMDVWYVDNRSAWLDIKIIGMTIGTVWRRQGIGEEGSATMRRFDAKP